MSHNPSIDFKSLVSINSPLQTNKDFTDPMMLTSSHFKSKQVMSKLIKTQKAGKHIKIMCEHLRDDIGMSDHDSEDNPMNRTGLPTITKFYKQFKEIDKRVQLKQHE